MLKNKKIAVVVPAYNEELLIKETISSIPEYIDEIVVIDDNSTDNTTNVVNQLNNPKVKLIKHSINSGVGKSIISGYKYSMKSGAQIIAVMAADNQMHPDDLINIITPVIEDKTNYCKGNRFLNPDILTQMPKIRIFANFCFSILSCIACGYYHIFDTQCGFTAIDRNTLEKLDLDNIYPRYGYPTDILAKLNMISAKVMDVPIKPVYKNECSGIKPVSYTLTILYLSFKCILYRQLSKVKKLIFRKNSIVISEQI